MRFAHIGRMPGLLALFVVSGCAAQLMPSFHFGPTPPEQLRRALVQYHRTLHRWPKSPADLTVFASTHSNVRFISAKFPELEFKEEDDGNSLVFQYRIFVGETTLAAQKFAARTLPGCREPASSWLIMTKIDQDGRIGYAIRKKSSNQSLERTTGSDERLD